MLGTVQNDKDLLIYFSSFQDKMLDFTKKEICVLSSRLKELLLAHPRDTGKRVIRIPSTLSNSTDELKLLLLLVYTGDLEGNRSITKYVELCERFEVPIGYAMCSLALRAPFLDTLLQLSIKVEQQKALQHIFVGVFEETPSMEVRQTVR
nr:hypothetical protein HmN_000911400 [Hymenolepis microstoma]